MAAGSSVIVNGGTVEQYAKTYAPGTVLFQEGDPGTEVYVVQTGRVRVTKRVFRTDVVVEDLGKGDFCGELALVMKTTRPGTAVVIDEAQLLVIPADQFEEMVSSNPAITLQMLKRLAARLTRAQFRLSNFALRQPLARLLHQLRAEWKVAHLQGRDGLALVPDDLAQALGMETGEVAGILERAVKDRIIGLDDDGTFNIPDHDAYDRLLSYLELRDRFEFAVQS
jgi:CRP/FNR family transcriptional regulator, cyclic AMP receptor protein